MRRMRAGTTWPSRLAVAALAVVTMVSACVEPGDSSQVVGGTSPSAELSAELARLDVALPPDATQLHWLLVSTWDTNDTFVRLGVSRAGAIRLLRESGIEMRTLSSPPTADSFDHVLPQRVLDGIPPQVARPSGLGVWTIGEAQRRSAVVQPMGSVLPSVGAIVLDPENTRPTVILHWRR